MKVEIIGKEKRDIPCKWPQAFITGQNLTVERAEEIITRTDGLVVSRYGGNNEDFNKTFLHESGLRIVDPDDWVSGKISSESCYKKGEVIKNVLGLIETNYIHNSWLSSSYVGGPYGWCHPSGKIFYNDNIGKHPCVESVVEDWRKLHEAFPFINVVCTLHNKEYGEPGIEPVVTLRIGAGKIYIDNDDHGGHYHPYSSSSALDTFRKNLNNPLREQGVPEDMVQRMVKSIRKKIDAVDFDKYDEMGELL